jgi:phosphopentomutase
LFTTIVLDGVGIGAQGDADRYGDAGSHTLRHVCEAARPHLPHLGALGLGNIAQLPSVPPAEAPRAQYGIMRELSAGKDSTTGHWELAGLHLKEPFPTYADGFPDEVIEAFVAATGCGGVLGNRPASGTVIVAELGAEHQQTGHPIVYTSADSVFQVAAHKEAVPLDTLYTWCRTAREDVCVGEHAVGRVIARPFVGPPGGYTRVSAERKDFSLPPPSPPVQQVLQEHGIRTVSIGKISNLFAGVGFDASLPTKTNAQGIAETLRQMQTHAAEGTPAFLWTNLIDFDQEYGHRNDPDGFARALEAFDEAVPDLIDAVPDGGVLVITADHGNDPTTPSTDHSREFVPLLVIGGNGRTDLGLRATFSDHAASVADYFGVPFETHGTSFL